MSSASRLLCWAVCCARAPFCFLWHWCSKRKKKSDIENENTHTHKAQQKRERLGTVFFFSFRKKTLFSLIVWFCLAPVQTLFLFNSFCFGFFVLHPFPDLPIPVSWLHICPGRAGEGHCLIFGRAARALESEPSPGMVVGGGGVGAPGGGNPGETLRRCVRSAPMSSRMQHLDWWRMWDCSLWVWEWQWERERLQKLQASWVHR